MAGEKPHLFSTLHIAFCSLFQRNNVGPPVTTEEDAKSFVAHLGF